MTAVIAHEDTVVDLKLEGGATVTTTENHPFWNDTDKQWQRADVLDRGDHLLGADGMRVRVDGLRGESRHVATAYNLSVSDIHTYHVIVGKAAVLVHNDGGLCDADAVNIAKHANQRALAGDGTHYVRGVHPDALPYYVDGVINGVVPNVVARYGLRNGRSAYWDPDKGAVVILDGTGGTILTPRTGRAYFDELE